MILEQEKASASIDGGATLIGKFNLREKNIAKMFSISRKTIYSNAILAVIREYSTNAVDAHIAAGIKDSPIYITLPTSEEPNFKVRDFGAGLSKEEIISIFCSYGESTKEDSNDFVGALGLGSKSSYCYGDSFMVISYHGGLKTAYNMIIGEDNLGDIIHLYQEEVGAEDTGLEIIVPVKHQDIYKFACCQ